MGDSGLTHQVDAFSSSADDLHTRRILQVIYMRDCSTTWNTSVHSIEQGFQIQSTLLEEFPEGHGDTVDDENFVSSTNRWSVGEDHTGFRGHTVIMRSGS